ncbi:phosphatase PAP2 family protein [uncultured Capnocytophaga sp.]|uniref:phosphatase PAP2 family protein n=1 Tax=uncultured Capnocytophaga sp. TaxID=159273 RepID=UPI00260A441E|nr:phosphatase PAP2 family protein [uncultured Capnocytophaga sp.]
MRLYVWLLMVAFFNNGIQAQEVVQDTIVHNKMVQDTIVHGEMMRDTLPQGHIPIRRPYIRPWPLVIPAALIARGALSIDSRFDHKLQRYVTDNVKGKLRIDDHLQYLPIAGVFALPNLGMEPAHNLKERVLIGATAYAMTAVFVNSLKYSIRQLRPDNSAHNSFPSGHTATVFTGVEMLYQEYKHSEPWVGITGYVVATGVGLLRIYNNRHWASDVVAGAGIGILSTKLSYLLFPYTSKLLQSKKERIARGASSLHMLAFPTYDAKTQGVGMGVVVSF